MERARAGTLRIFDGQTNTHLGVDVISKLQMTIVISSENWIHRALTGPIMLVPRRSVTGAPINFHATSSRLIWLRCRYLPQILCRRDRFVADQIKQAMPRDYAKRNWWTPKLPVRVPLHREPATLVHYQWCQFWALAHLRLYSSPGARENVSVGVLSIFSMENTLFSNWRKKSFQKIPFTGNYPKKLQLILWNGFS